MTAYYRGLLFGGLIGDCLGKSWEDKIDISPEELSKSVNEALVEGGAMLPFTDDTLMSLDMLNWYTKDSGRPAEALAKRFAQSYFDTPIDRYYGGHIHQTFLDWRGSHYTNVFTPPAQQFHGEGSLGNGGGMRIAQLCGFLHKMSVEDFNKWVVKTTMLTHTHPEGLFGTLIIAHAVRLILNERPNLGTVDACVAFVDRIMDALKASDLPSWLNPSQAEQSGFHLNEKSSKLVASSLQTYEELLAKVKHHLKQSDFPKSQIVRDLGNNVLARGSIATALYVFLHCINTCNDKFAVFGRLNEELRASLPFRCCFLSILLGGDTDTIACMAGALAGVYVGDNERTFPRSMLNRCESIAEIEAFAAQMDK